MFFSLPLDLREKIWTIVRNMRIDEIRQQMQRERIEKYAIIRRLLLDIEWLYFLHNYQPHYRLQSPHLPNYVGDISHG